MNTDPNSETYMEKAERVLTEYITSHLDKSDPLASFEVYIVWFSKTLQNWKCLMASTLPDQMYYELTYNGDKKQLYIDAYKKFDNVTVDDEVVS